MDKNHKTNFLSLWRASSTYWFLQLAGWSGMICLEMINYTFFLVGEFSWAYLQTFMLYAVVGILVTHMVRMILTYYEVFSKTSVVIWTVAAISTLAGSILSIILLFIPSYLADPAGTMESMTPIYFFGLVMNNGRYFLIWMVIYFLYQIMEQRNQVAEERYEHYLKAKNFELELLKRQVNPHFLFNALNSIKALVLIDAEKSRGALIKLSELLRYNLNHEQQQLVTIEDELDEVRKYFALEQLRYGQRLTISYDISPMVLPEFIPSVLILTLAENAIKHGVAKNPGDTHIQVSADGNEHGYRVSVANKGTIDNKRTAGIGSRHIRRRLEEHFGHRGVYTLQESSGTVIASIEVKQNETKNTIDRRRTSGIRRVEGVTGESRRN